MFIRRKKKEPFPKESLYKGTLKFPRDATLKALKELNYKITHLQVHGWQKESNLWKNSSVNEFDMWL